jgi:hypothetical protein
MLKQTFKLYMTCTSLCSVKIISRYPYEWYRFFLYLMRTLMTMHSWNQPFCTKTCWTCLVRLVRICMNMVPTLYVMLVIMTHYFVRFRLRMWEIWNFQWFLTLKLQINLLKIGFGRKNQLRTCSHLKVYHSIQGWFCFILDSSKMGYTLQTMSYVDFTLYCNMGSHLSNSTGHTSVTYFCLRLLPYQFFCLPCPLFLLKKILLHTHKTPSWFRFLQRKTWHRKPFRSLFESKSFRGFDQ